MSADSIARLKITLDDVEPMVLRRIEVPLGIRLDRLHLAIRAAMGWTNSHLYENPRRRRRVGHSRSRLGRWSTRGTQAPPDRCDRGYRHQDDAIPLRLRRRLGAHHQDRAVGPADRDATYPRLIEATGRCPPEDVGGPPGYEELLEAIADPQHERHAEMRESCGEDFDPTALDLAQIEQALSKLVIKPSQPSRPKKKPAAK